MKTILLMICMFALALTAGTIIPPVDVETDTITQVLNHPAFLSLTGGAVGIFGGLAVAKRRICKLLSTVINLREGYSIFMERHINDLLEKDSPLRSDFISFVVKPLDSVTEALADITEKMRLDKLTTRLRGIINSEQFNVK